MQTNQDTVNLQRVTTLHERFTSIARENPNRVALQHGQRAVTYGQLELSSTAWAGELAQHGVGEGSIVPIMLPRSVELVTAILAVLKLGAAFAPIDRDKMRNDLEHIGSLLSGSMAIAPEGFSIPGLQSWSPPARHLAVTSMPSTRCYSDAEQAACVFFTSGTTGRPKAVVVPHVAVGRLFGNDSFARFDREVVMPLAAATPWDAFALELWGTLLSGGRGVIVDEPFLTPAVLRKLVAKDNVNTAWITSGLFNMVVEEDLGAFDGLRQVLIGGERLSERHVAAFLDVHPHISLINGYGPVESTIFVTSHRISSQDVSGSGGIPLGVCVPGTTVFVLDGERECAEGEEGEICIAGDGLAIEYLGDPALTAAAFAYIPLRGEIQRVYRTGDMGMWAPPDGLLEFRGRADRQVKIRGHRVELQGLEVLIADLVPQVASCLIVPRKRPDGSTDLLAFCIPEAKGDELTTVRSRLHDLLPPHLIPSEILAVRSFPLTDRGKVDPHGLLALASKAPEGQAHTADERSPKHDPHPFDLISESPVHAVRRILGGILGHEIDDNTSFFLAGGTSLDAGRACARLEEEVGQVVPVSVIYERPTIAGLASWLEERQESSTRGSRGGPHEDPPGMSDAQQWFLLRDLLDANGLTNHCLMMWRLDGAVDLDALARAVAGVHGNQPSLRAGYRLDATPMVVEDQGKAPLMTVLAAEPSMDLARHAVLEELSKGLDPTIGDCWRAVWVPVADDRSVLGCVVHHVAFDGWSEKVLADELSAWYRGVSPGEVPSLMAIERRRSSIADAVDPKEQASRLAEALRGAGSIQWCQNEPSPIPPVNEGVSTYAVDIPVKMVEALLSHGRENSARLLHVLLAGWALAMDDVLNIADVVVGVPVSTRNGRDLEKTIGCHIATVPVRVLLTDERRGDGALADAITSVVRAADLAMSCQDAPMADVVQTLIGELDAGRLYDVIFAVQDNPTPTLELSGVTAHFERPLYRDLPVSMHCEAWLHESGTLRIEISVRRDRVPESVAQALIGAFEKHLKTIARG